jgi:hypothetical protein
VVGERWDDEVAGWERPESKGPHFVEGVAGFGS